MHTTSGRWGYGLFLALLTALLWGILPIKLKQVLQVVDPITVTWYRLLVSGGLLFAWLAAQRRLPSIRKLAPRGKGLVLVAVLGLMGNYVLYLIGLKLLSPGTAQLVVQIGPVLLLVASVFVFRERFSVGQGMGLLVLLAGFGLFFNQRLEELLTSLGTYTTGVLTILLATSIWVFYALSQKQLLTVWHSQQVMMVIYLSCAALLTPWVHPLEALQLTPVQGWLLLACCLNTLVAYGAFAEALAHWEASRVSATLALTPLVTFVAVALAALVWPEYVHAEDINALGYVGAVTVVFGSALVALGPSLMAGWRARRARLAGTGYRAVNPCRPAPACSLAAPTGRTAHWSGTSTPRPPRARSCPRCKPSWQFLPPCHSRYAGSAPSPASTRAPGARPSAPHPARYPPRNAAGSCGNHRPAIRWIAAGYG